MFLFHHFIYKLGKTGTFLRLEVVYGGGNVLERLPGRQSLYPQIAVHALFLVLLGVMH
jgi:hypothetical protein